MALFTDRSIDFDGTNDHISIGNVAALSFERTNAFSISLWLVRTGTLAGVDTIYSKTGGSPYNGIELAFNTTSGIATFRLRNTTTTNELQVSISAAPFDAPFWHHLVWTYDGSSLASGVLAYIDGQAVATTIVSDTLSATILGAFPASIGSTNGTANYFQGRMTEVSVYSKALTAGEVTTIYNGGFPLDLTVSGPTGDLVGYWRLGEHSFSTVPDLSPSGNNGTMTNMVAGDIVIDAPAYPPVSDLGYAYQVYPIGVQVGDAGSLLGIDYVPRYVPTKYFKMRALANPGPGYVTWVVHTAPDYTASYSSFTIQAATAVITSEWGIDELEYSTIPEDKTLTTTSGPALVVDPRGEVLFLGIATDQVSWADLDVISLPATPFEGSEIILKDIGGQADIKRITVDGNSKDIDGLASYIIDVPYGSLHLVFSASQWSAI